MTEEQLSHLFNAFTQADTSTTRKYGGTGLGLAITQNLIDMMGGTVSVESEYGKGTSFILQIPFGVAEIQTVNTKIIPEVLTELDIAVVEDNETAMEVYKSYLGKLPQSIDYFIDAETFLEASIDKEYDLILMDYRLPGINGIDAWKKMTQWFHW